MFLYLLLILATFQDTSLLRSSNNIFKCYDNENFVLNMTHTPKSLNINIDTYKGFLNKSGLIFKSILTQLSHLKNSEVDDILNIDRKVKGYTEFIYSLDTITNFIYQQTFNSDIGCYIDMVLNNNGFDKVNLQSKQSRCLRCFEFFVFNLIKGIVPQLQDDVACRVYDFLVDKYEDNLTYRSIASSYSNIVSDLLAITINQ